MIFHIITKRRIKVGWKDKRTGIFVECILSSRTHPNGMIETIAEVGLEW